MSENVPSAGNLSWAARRAMRQLAEQTSAARPPQTMSDWEEMLTTVDGLRAASVALGHVLKNLATGSGASMSVIATDGVSSESVRAIAGLELHEAAQHATEISQHLGALRHAILEMLRQS